MIIVDNVVRDGAVADDAQHRRQRQRNARALRGRLARRARLRDRHPDDRRKRLGRLSPSARSIRARSAISSAGDASASSSRALFAIAIALSRLAALVADDRELVETRRAREIDVPESGEKEKRAEILLRLIEIARSRAAASRAARATRDRPRSSSRPRRAAPDVRRRAQRSARYVTAERGARARRGRSRSRSRARRPSGRPSVFTILNSTRRFFSHAASLWRRILAGSTRRSPCCAGASCRRPRCDERAHDAVHAVLREAQVVLVGRALVGVAGDLDERELGVVDERRRHGVEDLVRLRQDLRRCRLELDLLRG